MTNLRYFLDRDLERLWNRMDQFPKMSPEFSPHVDIEEMDDHFLIHAELPGVTKENIEVEVEDRLLTIKGEKSFKKESNTSEHRLIERSFGKFQRSFQLPQAVDAEKIETQFENGVLSIAVPKHELSRKRKIEVGQKKSGSIFDRLVGSSKKDLKVAG